jgi:hypothetical protein
MTLLSLYGGLSPDWLSGGEWRNQREFLKRFIQAIGDSRLFLNGALPIASVWLQEQLAKRGKVNKVFHVKDKYIYNSDWVAPTCIETETKLHWNHNYVHQSKSHHELEIINACIEKQFKGLVTTNLHLICLVAVLAQIGGRYSWLRNLKIFDGATVRVTANNAITADIIDTDKIFKKMKLTPPQFLCILDFFGAAGFYKNENFVKNFFQIFLN